MCLKYDISLVAKMCFTRASHSIYFVSCKVIVKLFQSDWTRKREAEFGLLICIFKQTLLFSAYVRKRRTTPSNHTFKESKMNTTVTSWKIYFNNEFMFKLCVKYYVLEMSIFLHTNKQLSWLFMKSASFCTINFTTYDDFLKICIDSFYFSYTYLLQLNTEKVNNQVSS